MTSELDYLQGIVRVCDGDGKTVGTGFLAASNLIVTCAHVIDYAESMPSESVNVIFLSNEQTVPTFIEFWSAASQYDVAVLRLLEPPPANITPLWLGTSINLLTEQHKFLTYGFPAGVPMGVIGHGTILGEHHARLQLQSNEVTEGFSGAPILSLQTRRVVGMVVERSSRDFDQYGSTGRLTETAFATPSQILRSVCPELALNNICPYQGLSAFTEQEAEFFCGRDALVEELIERLRKNPQFLAIVGPSGSGKSSVVRAGLVPKLPGLFPKLQQEKSRQQEKSSFPASVPIFRMRPSSAVTPEESLLASISAQTFDAENIWMITVPQTLNQQPGRCILLIDQFEELFSLFPDQQASFIEGLNHLLPTTPYLTLIITMRSDFYAPLQQSALGHFLPNHQVNVGGLLEPDLTTIITQPANQVGLQLEDGLKELILTDLHKTKNPLPLLEFTLKQLWLVEHDQNRLTCATYVSPAIGRVTGAIARWANDTYNLLSDTEKDLTRRIFTRLIHYGFTKQPDTRQPQPLETLIHIHSTPSLVRSLIQKLANARLLVADRDVVEIIHDVLITEWAELKNWIEDERPFLLWRDHFQANLKAWQSNKKSGDLLSDNPLAMAENFLKGHRADLNVEECRYIEASLERRDRQQKLKLLVSFTISGLSLLALLAIGVAWFQGQRAEESFRAFLLGFDPPKPELLGKLPDYLEYANKLKSINNPDNADLVLAYYRRILSASDELQGDMQRNPEKYSSLQGRQDILEMRKQAERSIIDIIVEDRLPKIRKMLKAGEFGRRKTEAELNKARLKKNPNFNPNDEVYDYLNLEDNFTEGALRYTYSVLMGNVGLGADLNKNGMLDKQEASKIPCELLEKIEELWRQETNNRCGWYGEKFDVASRCGELNELTLTTSIFEPPYDIVIDRFDQCEIKRENLH